MLELEDKLRFARNYQSLQETLRSIDELAEAIYTVNQKYVYDNRIKQLALEIRKMIENYDNSEGTEE